MSLCWFCGQPINPHSGRADRHHLVCRRYLKKREGRVFNRPDNVVYTCVEHHRRFHREHDQCRWSLDEFLANMEEIDFGRLIYAAAD